MAIIYLLTNIINGKQYVGQTIRGLDERWWYHCWSANRGAGYLLHKAIRKYGPDAFTHEILEHTTIEDVNAREIYWIAELKTREHGYNMTDGGEGTRGWVPDEEWRTKIGAANRGKKLSAEHRAKLSVALSGENNPMYGKKGEKNHMYGKTRSSATRVNISVSKSGENNPNYGKHHSAEHRAKLSVALSGENNPMYGKTGENSPNYGKTLSTETRAKMSEARKMYWLKRRLQKEAVAPKQ